MNDVRTPPPPPPPLLRCLRKGEVEGEHNPHFCMPGPPNEIGVLLLKMAWALYDEREEASEAAEEHQPEAEEEHGETETKGRDDRVEGKAGVRRR